MVKTHLHSPPHNFLQHLSQTLSQLNDLITQNLPCRQFLWCTLCWGVWVYVDGIKKVSPHLRRKEFGGHVAIDPTYPECLRGKPVEKVYLLPLWCSHIDEKCCLWEVVAWINYTQRVSICILINFFSSCHPKRMGLQHLGNIWFLRLCLSTCVSFGGCH